jgi:hypothetical protein
LTGLLVYLLEDTSGKRRRESPKGAMMVISDVQMLLGPAYKTRDYYQSSVLST